MHSYKSILKIVLHGRSAGKILLATIFSFTFSIAVILCTFGLMDGFDHLLKSGLRHSSGDVLITSKRGFFNYTTDLRRIADLVHPTAVAPVIQSEAFALYGEASKGVLIRGIEDASFSEATGLNVKVPRGEIALGEELAKQLKVERGDNVSLMLAKGNDSGESLPTIETFTVGQTVKHGIYQKDLRFVYLNGDELGEILNLRGNINLLIIGVEDASRALSSLDKVTRAQETLRGELSSQYLVKPFWHEYEYLLEAVKYEKASISLILQLIVVVAIFNIIAFVIYIMEKKAQEFFFLRAVGLSLKSLSRFWFISVVYIWIASCIGAYFFTEFFNWCLKNVSFLQIPGEVYVLSSLSVRLDAEAYITVYGASFVWILLASCIGYLRLKKRPIIQGLRQEFSS